ncbi:hypothetical protein GCM10008171_33220 [Methylopila jiangsuensis]|uniref:Helix-turn-helix domain-containing protein n=1 Tax=Methylopila jiangsuensis TaxID=586230 RepID=A0A9W6JM79_9HYPH|nr:DNA-binding transcriptional regulator YiaG [Methylopila jiangsuensis]GLK78068.1 hypothetical protein GCM10008171_33220 [Methylopila jiangsuensis]
MVNHPKRSTRNRPGTPTPEQIKAAREAVGLTQKQAADLVQASSRAWQNWEAPVGSPEGRAMRPALWEMFRAKAGIEP